MYIYDLIKKIIALLLSLVIIFGLFEMNLKAYGYNDYFVVTAYYSPLPNQNYYLTGDYKSEKRLNGQGIRGASGREVFSGMLAAPRNYAFGTKIKLEGLGIGVVEDRGGAIVNAGNRGYSHDRIDVWVGYGDEGLRRALYWGKRKIRGTIVSKDTGINLDYNIIASPLWATKNLKETPSIFNKGIGKGSSKDLVISLQKFLYKLGLYTGEINGIYNREIISLVYDFQIENKILDSEYDYGAGYWGKTTRKLFLKKYFAGEFDIEEKNITDNKKIKERSIFDFPVKTKEDIIKLQEILTKLGYYTGEINGIYNSVKLAVLNYQLDNDVIRNKYDLGASHYGPKTRVSLKKSYEEYLKLEKRKAELEKQFKDLESISFKDAKKEFLSIGKPVLGEVSPRVRSLQQLLSSLGYFEHKDTAIFGNKTKEAIIKFQLKSGVISSKDDKGAGVFGPQTRETLESELAKVILKEKIKEKELDEKTLASFGIYKI